jgi:2-dehydro-3-deoxyphosphogluconate aldolase/(4S)-4-hydroxy-2-oxoglutarate aldolase
MTSAGFVPVFNHDDPAVAVSIVGALVAGGAQVVEFTNRSDNAPGTFDVLVAHCAETHPHLVVGVGSVLDAGTAARYLSAGAAFVVGPTTEPPVARVCSDAGVPYVPGCGTATEISRAASLGCDLIKVFPGDAAGGPSFVRAVLGPMPWVKLMPTGGVDITDESLRSWFDAGVACVGLGSRLVSGDLIEAGDWQAMTTRTRAVAHVIQEIRRG